MAPPERKLAEDAARFVEVDERPAAPTIGWLGSITVQIEIITSLGSTAVALSGVWASVWSAKNSSRTTFSDRRLQRQGEAYVEALSNANLLLERHRAIETNCGMDHAEFQYFGKAVPDPVDITAITRTRALLSAFGSPTVRQSFTAWEKAVQAFEAHLHNIGINGESSQTDLDELRAEFQAEESALADLTDAMSAELIGRHA